MARYQMRGRRVIARVVTVPDVPEPEPLPEPEPEPEPVSRRSLFFMSKAALVTLAESRGVDSDGTRAELIGRLA